MNQITLEPDTEEIWALRDAGLISDNAATWQDVAACDQERALKWLAVRKGDLL